MASKATFKRTAKRGNSTVAYSGRIGKTSLAPGRYVIEARAVDAAGNASQAATVKVTIVRR